MTSPVLQLYGVPLDAADSDPRLIERRLDLAHSAATLLDRNNLINYDRRSGTVRVCKARLSLASCHQILDVVHAFSFKLCTQRMPENCIRLISGSGKSLTGLVYLEQKRSMQIK